MIEKELLLSLILFFIGIFILYFSSIFYKPKILKIQEITKELIGKKVCVEGEISYVRRTKKAIFIKVFDNTQEIFIPIFSYLANKISEKIEKGKRVVVCGVVDEYKGILELKPYSLNDIKFEE